MVSEALYSWDLFTGVAELLVKPSFGSQPTMYWDPGRISEQLGMVKDTASLCNVKTHKQGTEQRQGSAFVNNPPSSVQEEESACPLSLPVPTHAPLCLLNSSGQICRRYLRFHNSEPEALGSTILKNYCQGKKASTRNIFSFLAVNTPMMATLKSLS